MPADGNQSGAAIAWPGRLWAARPLEGRGAVLLPDDAVLPRPWSFRHRL